MSDITYENIKCDENQNGQKCSFPKKILTKLKMLATIAVVSGVAVVTFSGCESVKEDIKQTTTISATSAYVQMMKEKITAKPVTEQITKKVVETIDLDKQDNEYNKLLELLNNELSKKSFSEEVKTLFLDTFDVLYKNYLGWKKGYKDLPGREEYIKTNLIDVIESIDKINFYRSNSEEANKLLEDGMPFAWVENDKDDRVILNIISEPANTKIEEDRLESIEKFFHEIIHCKENGIILSEDMDYIFQEGRSNFSYAIYKTGK